MTSSLSPRIYVACLASYNAGTLHGEWIYADQDEEGIQDEINVMLESSPAEGAEEFAIHDFDDFGGVTVNEYESIKDVAELANNLCEYGEAFALWVNNGNEYDSAPNFENSYCGCYESEEDFAYDDMNSLYEIPDFLVNYIDYESIARDYFCGDFWSSEGSEGTHVFRSI